MFALARTMRQSTEKSFRTLFPTESRDGSPSKAAFVKLRSLKTVPRGLSGASLGALERLLERSGTLLDALAALLGALGALLGRSWGALGKLLSALGALLGGSWALLGRCRALLGGLGAPTSLLKRGFLQQKKCKNIKNSWKNSDVC